MIKPFLISFALTCTAILVTDAAHAQDANHATDTVTIDSDRSPTEVASCFRASADFASFAHFARYAETGSISYRLRFDTITLEHVRFMPRSGGGSHIEITLSADYSRRDRAGFQQVRGNALARCAQPAMQVAANTISGRGQ